MCGRTASASLKELYFHRSCAWNTPFPRPGHLHTCYERLKRYDGLSRTVPVLSKKGWLQLSQNLRKDSRSARPCRTTPAFVRCVLRPPLGTTPPLGFNPIPAPASHAFMHVLCMQTTHMQAHTHTHLCLTHILIWDVNSLQKLPPTLQGRVCQLNCSEV